MDNCTPEVSDLFSKIFTVDGEKRINFADIRGHELFSDYFPEISHQSMVLYKSKKKKMNKLDSFIQAKMSGIQGPGKKPNPRSTLPQNPTANTTENAAPAFQVNRPKLSEEKSYIEMEMEKIKFLY